jgi:hypothetical protein
MTNDLHEIIIVVQGGVVCEVYASEDIIVSLLDYDLDPDLPEPEDLVKGLKIQRIKELGERHDSDNQSNL